MGGSAVQVEGVVTACDVQFRPRRQLVVTIVDATGSLTMRFLNFYGSQTRQFVEGNRIRARGELRHGFFGAEMVHPNYKVVLEGAPLPKVLTPVYPAGEGISQAILRKAIALFDVVAEAKAEKKRFGILDKDRHLLTEIVGI